ARFPATPRCPAPEPSETESGRGAGESAFSPTPGHSARVVESLGPRRRRRNRRRRRPTLYDRRSRRRGRRRGPADDGRRRRWRRPASDPRSGWPRRGDDNRCAQRGPRAPRAGTLPPGGHPRPCPTCRGTVARPARCGTGELSLQGRLRRASRRAPSHLRATIDRTLPRRRDRDRYAAVDVTSGCSGHEQHPEPDHHADQDGAKSRLDVAFTAGDGLPASIWISFAHPLHSFQEGSGAVGPRREAGAPVVRGRGEPAKFSSKAGGCERAVLPAANQRL
ncbi:MAG: hypothetical protein AVDCRST_MAG53-1968, partial [uncultured Solirubrobacteraceae bacterium]